MSALSVRGLKVVYSGRHGLVTALSDFSVEIPEGGMMVLLGESGCGKTTALNTIAGLTDATAGEIRLGEDSLLSSRNGRVHAVPPNRRDIGMVFQSYALWPHLSVIENVMYPLRRRGAGRDEAARAAREALETVRCQALASRFPGELSGGQQQRVALARAIVSRPKLLLFDEPLSNLDASLRRGLRDELARLHRELGFTGLYVTHDQSEALSLGSAVAVMDHGRIIQSGTPQSIYEQPGSEFVARFFGANILSGRVVRRDNNAGIIDTPAGPIASDRITCDGEVTIAFMPQAVSLQAASDAPLRVTDALYVGSHRELRVAGAGVDLLVTQPAAHAFPPPDSCVALKIAPDQVHVFPAVRS